MDQFTYNGRVMVPLDQVEKLQQENAHLRDIAYTDTLTRLPNRRSFEEILDYLSSEADRGSTVTIGFYDLDHFKERNDNEIVGGHAVGDDILKNAADSLRYTFRRRSDGIFYADDVVEELKQGDVQPARLGGDEFVTVASNTREHAAVQAFRVSDMYHLLNKQYAYTHAQKLLAQGADPEEVREHLPILYDSGMSIGLATAVGAFDLCKLLQMADAAVYEVKRGGRDGVAVFGPGMDRPQRAIMKYPTNQWLTDRNTVLS